MENGAKMEVIACRLEEGKNLEIDEASAIMGLLGYEVANHARLGWACRKISEGGRWQSMPSFRDAKDAEIWLRLENTGGIFNDIGQEDDGGWYASFRGEFGNDYGESRTLGLAMFAGFIRSQGRADRGDN